MSCTKPLLMRVLGVNPDTHKKIVVPIRYWTDLKEYDHDDNVIKVPCGKCLSCRLARASEWSDRIMLEASNYKDNCFITLTYDNEHLPDEIIDEKIGLIYNPLVKRDLQLFFKRLRKKFSHKKIRFFAVGEFGSVSNRPHYHAIIFNHNFDDLKPLFYNKGSGEWCFKSETLDKLWKKGICSVGTLTKASAGYVARYSVKNQFLDKKEFLLMSRNPGIGRDYFDRFKRDIYMTDKIYFNFSKDKKITKPFRYFDKLLEQYDLELFDEVKDKRKELGKVFSENELMMNDTPYLEVVNAKKDEKLHKNFKTLKRGLE